MRVFESFSTFSYIVLVIYIYIQRERERERAGDKRKITFSQLQPTYKRKKKLNLVSYKPNGGNKTGCEGTIRKAQKQTTIAHTCRDLIRMSNNQDTHKKKKEKKRKKKKERIIYSRMLLGHWQFEVLCCNIIFKCP